MTQDAERVFYTFNRIIITDDPNADVDITCPKVERTKLLEALVFFTRFFFNGKLHVLRKVEIMFTARQHSHLGFAPHVLEDWTQTLSTIAPQLRDLSLAPHRDDDALDL
jgi:hypothetical protein